MCLDPVSYTPDAEELRRREEILRIELEDAQRADRRRQAAIARHGRDYVEEREEEVADAL